MHRKSRERRWFWATLILSSISIVALVFAFWELVENRFFRDLNYVALHYLYISRGIASSILLAVWAAWFVLRQRRQSEQELRRSRERYRGLLEASPAAVVLYDRGLRVLEWNAAAEHLYGFAKAEVIGQKLPTIASEDEPQLQEILQRVEAEIPLLERETHRLDREGSRIEVQLSLLPFYEGGRTYFLEVTSDIRERVQLRSRLIEFEKLTTMGQMAAGTAHHLNTPLAAMLLRVQMMRETAQDSMSADLERLETSIRFCQQFVRRLLDFSRRPAAQKQPEELAAIVEAAIGFFSPSAMAKNVRLTTETYDISGARVFVDRNQIETVLLVLLSNALDAMHGSGSIHVAARRQGEEQVEISVLDTGCGIAESDRRRVFEPFFTTKPPGKGTGLGLALARNIIHEHGGSLRLESPPGAGTAALISLPVYLPAAQAQEVAP